jgi:hypothetical protein
LPQESERPTCCKEVSGDETKAVLHFGVAHKAAKDIMVALMATTIKEECEEKKFQLTRCQSYET